MHRMDTKNLSDEAAIAQLKRIAKGEPTMFCTFGADGGLQARPMATLDVADDGTLWFFSARTSEKNRAIASNPQVRLMYSVSSKSEYLTVAGTASISRDQKKIDQYWNIWAKNWFPAGKDDPELTVIMVTAFSGHYWDNKTNRMIQLAKVAVGALTGTPMDDSVEGELRV